MLKIIKGKKKEIGAYDLLLLLFCEAKRRGVVLRTQDLLNTIMSLANEYPDFFDEWEFKPGTHITCENFEEHLFVYSNSGLINNVRPPFLNEKILLNVSVEAIEINYKDLSLEGRNKVNELIEEIFQGLENLKQRALCQS